MVTALSEPGPGPRGLERLETGWSGWRYAPLDLGDDG
jgi:hypothetical protein